VAEEKKSKERRTYQRFTTKSCTIAVSSTIGQIVDISMGGVSFSYIDTGKLSKNTSAQAIVFGKDDLCLDEFPLRIISDCSMGKGISMMRRCGAVFDELTSKQLSQLEHFIWVNSMLEHTPKNSD